jgi:hypothetical protein
MVAPSQVIDRDNLCRFPPHHDPELMGSPESVIALIREEGWPMTKAGYVRAMFWPYLPTFPLDRDIVALVPDDLKGAIPTKATDVLFDSRPYVDVMSIADLEEAIRSESRDLLLRRRRGCAIVGHAWFEMKKNTYALGRELYCAHCLILQVATFRGWPVPPPGDAPDARGRQMRGRRLTVTVPLSRSRSTKPTG